MFSVRNKFGTVLILGFVNLALAGAFDAAADVTTEQVAGELNTPVGTYAPGDGAALQGVLDAPARSDAADSSFELAPELKINPASMRNVPESSPQPALELDSRFEAWDMKNGTIVPEPATALLMGAGLAALAVYRGMRGKVITD